MISWSDCSIDWKDAKTISKITHVVSGVSIDLDIECDGKPDKDGKIRRDEALKELDAKVEAMKS